ncbi:helix-turn-helix domain-containing protein [Cupriavidus sp. CuC1]|uniref:helix-turn-helix domain-containing protein n=1 Tax=Cupriavidus sp. CuC1 TaxID=3373131 RepID=UPI0037D1FB9F
MDGKGFLRVRGAVKAVARRLDCSTATIYRYLARIAEHSDAVVKPHAVLRVPGTYAPMGFTPYF